MSSPSKFAVLVLTRLRRRTDRYVLRESFNEPAKLAKRVIAPGDGEAEPGVTATNFQRACEAGADSSRGYCNEKIESRCLHLSPVAHFMGSDVNCIRFPRLGFAIAWGYHSLRQLRRLVECFLPTDYWLRTKKPLSLCLNIRA